MALTANTLVDTKIRGVDGNTFRYSVAASADIFIGAFVRIDAGGDIEPCAGTSVEPCLGISLDRVDNSGGVDGALDCDVLVGAIIQHALSGATIADIGTAVYTSDDSTLTTTSTTNEFVGFIINVPSAAVVVVKMAIPGQPAS